MVDLEDKVKLFDSEIIIETIRQWFELIIGITLFIWFLLCAFRMKETLKSWCILDTILILSLSLRVLCVLIYEFLVPTRIFMFFADNIYVIVMLLILYIFSTNLRYSHTHEQIRNQSITRSMSHLFVSRMPIIDFNIHKFALLYVLGACVVILTNTVFSIVTFKESFFCEGGVETTGEEINNLILACVEISVGCFNLYFCIKFIQNIDRYAAQNAVVSSNNSDQISRLDSLLHQKEDFKTAKKQLIFLGCGGLICSLYRGCVVGFSWYLIKESPNYICFDHMFFMPLNNWISLFLFIKMIGNLLPTVMLFYVIYIVPYQSGKIKRLEMYNEDISIRSSTFDSQKDVDVSDIKKSNEDEGFLFNKQERNKTSTIMDRKSFNGNRSSYDFELTNLIVLKRNSSPKPSEGDNCDICQLPKDQHRHEASKSVKTIQKKREESDDSAPLTRGESEQVRFLGSFKNE